MGITGLLPYLKKASRQANIKEFKGCTVAIDTYCWLHKGAFACAEKLAMGEKTDQYVYYCMKYVNFLLAEGIKPVMVFDGCHLPSKKDVEKARRERRDTYRKKAAQFLREGKRSEARDCLTKCIDITPQMALELMNACRAKGVDCIVAPYEADSQLGYLAKTGIAQVIITEDSDLVLFGCDKVMFKMDFSGHGVLIEKKNLNTAMDLRPDTFTFDKFRYMCILSGCDYLASLPGIGLGKATKLFKLTRQTDMRVILKKLPTTLNMSSLTVPDEYLAGFTRADHTFLYQRVFDPRTRRLVPLNPYPPEVDPAEMDYAGPFIEQEKAYQIALGNIDIYNGQKMNDFDPDTFKPKSQSWKHSAHGQSSKNMLHMLSIWDKNYRPMSKISVNERNDSLLSHMTGSTKGREVTVDTKKVLPKRSPVKAVKRKIEEPVEDPQADALLLSSYQPDPERADDAYHASTKRARPDDFSTTDHFRSPSPKKKRSLSPKKRAFMENSPAKNHGSPRKKFLSPPPGRNMFAAANQETKNETFDLNASKKLFVSPKKEVKSRFFMEKKPLRQTDFFAELDKGHDVVEHPEDEDEDDEDADESNSEEDPHTPPLPTVKTEAPATADKPAPSPYRSFGFGAKQKSSLLSKFKSDFDKSEKSTKQFKPVVPKKDKELTEHRSSLLAESQQRGCGADSGDEFESVSQSTNLYSIDSFSQLDIDFDSSQNISASDLESRTSLESSKRDSVCSRLSGDLVTTDSSNKLKSTKLISLPKSKSSSSFYQRLAPDDVKESPSGNNHTNNGTCSTDTDSSKASSKASKPVSGCRASGLSKATTKKGRPAQDKANSENQPAISSFFKNFSYSKSSSDKLSSSAATGKTKKVLSPHKDN